MEAISAQKPRRICEILREQPNAVAIYGISANPPQRAHRETVIQLRQLGFEKVIVYLSGVRSDKPELGEIDSKHRAAMAILNFGDIDGVEIVTTDIDEKKYSTSYELDQRFKEHGLNPWHVFGWDTLQGGKDSKIFREWRQGREFWEEAQILPFKRARYDFDSNDLPPSTAYPVSFNYDICSENIRELVSAGKSIDHLVTQEIARYIQEKNLYRIPTTQQIPPVMQLHHREVINSTLSNADALLPPAPAKDGELWQHVGE